MQYRVKWVDFRGARVPVVLQNSNGPCPLLAVCNILFLRRAISLNDARTSVTLDVLLGVLTGYLDNKLAKTLNSADAVGDGSNAGDTADHEGKHALKGAEGKGDVGAGDAVAVAVDADSDVERKRGVFSAANHAASTREMLVANYLRNYEDTVALLPRLEAGLDINVHFDSCCAFEFTTQLAMFDQFDVRLFHG